MPQLFWMRTVRIWGPTLAVARVASGAIISLVRFTVGRLMPAGQCVEIPYALHLFPDRAANALKGWPVLEKNGFIARVVR